MYIYFRGVQMILCLSDSNNVCGVQRECDMAYFSCISSVLFKCECKQLQLDSECTPSLFIIISSIYKEKKFSLCAESQSSESRVSACMGLAASSLLAGGTSGECFSL